VTIAHPVGDLAPAPWSEARALEFMHDAGIDAAITSILDAGNFWSVPDIKTRFRCTYYVA
jgi:hypothetical protein